MQPRSLGSCSLGPQSAVTEQWHSSGDTWRGRQGQEDQAVPLPTASGTVANGAGFQGPRLEAQLCFSLAETSRAPGLKLWGLGEESCPAGCRGAGLGTPACFPLCCEKLKM